MTQYTELQYRPDPTTGQGQQVYNPTSGKAYSSPAQLAGDLGILPNQIDWTKIGKASAGDLTNGQSLIQTNIGTKGTGGVSSIDAMLVGYQQQFKDETEAMKTSAQRVADAPQFSAQETLNQQMQSSGINETMAQSNKLIAEAGAIRENIAKLEDAKNQEILGMREKGGVSQYTMNARENLAEMKWNSRISAESSKLSGYAATIDALNGNITRAQTFITQAVNAATYDQEQNLNRLTSVYEMNKDLFTAMGSQYQNAFNQAINIKQQELSDTKTEKTNVLKFQADAASNYGVVLDLSGMNYEQASKAYADAVSPLQQQNRALEIAKAKADINATNRSNQNSSVVLTQSQLNSLANAGVPNNIATYIQQNKNVGNSDDAMINDLVTNNKMSQEQAKKYIADYNTFTNKQGAGIDALIEAINR